MPISHCIKCGEPIETVVPVTAAVCIDCAEAPITKDGLQDTLQRMLAALRKKE